MTTRRTLLKATASLAIMPSAALAGAEHMPADHERDRELIRLGVVFEEAWSIEEAAAVRARQTGDWSEWDAAFEITSDIVDEVVPMPAKSLAGLKVKARCVQWCYGSDPVQLNEQDTTDIRLALSIIASLLGGVS